MQDTSGLGIAVAQGPGMHRILSEIAANVERRGGCEADMPSARLALLVVVDRLGDVLSHREMEQLAGSLPLALALIVRRRSEVEPDPGLIDMVDEDAVLAVCEVLAARVGGRLGVRLRLDVPRALRGTPVDALLDGAPSSDRPTVPVMGVAHRPTVRAMRAA
jgi:hypothetical protein